MQGTKVMVEGEIVTGNYEDKDTGKKIYTTEVYANRIEDVYKRQPVTVPYPLLSSDLSFSRLDKVSYIYVPLCFPQTYPYLSLIHIFSK